MVWNNVAGKCFVINLQSSLQYYILVVTVFAPAVKFWMPASQANVACTIFKYSTTSSMSYSKTASRIYLVLYILVGFKTLFKGFCLFFLFWNLI